MARTWRRHPPDRSRRACALHDIAVLLTERFQETGAAVASAETYFSAPCHGLAAVSHAHGRGHVFAWRRALDATRWLRERGVPGVDLAGYGVWIEDGHTVRFVLHIDHDAPALSRAPVPPAADALAGYRHARGVPVTAAVLVLCGTADRQAGLHHALAADPLPVTVGSTTVSALVAVDSAAETIWTATPGDGRLLRLAQLAL